jgi:hypothetical protein
MAPQNNYSKVIRKALKEYKKKYIIRKLESLSDENTVLNFEIGCATVCH